MSDEALRDFYDSKRVWLQQNEAAYMEAVERIRETLPDVFLRLCRTLAAAVPEDPSRSHWIVAQCRMLVASLEEDAKLVTGYEQTKKRIMEHDLKTSKEEAA